MKQLAVVFSGLLCCFGLMGQEPRFVLPLGHTNVVKSAIFSPDGKKIVTASQDNTAKIWDVISGSLLVILNGHTNSVNSAIFSSDGKKILTASNDNTAKIWDAVTGQLLATLSGHTDFVNSAVFCSDDKKIATASNDNIAKIWDAVTGQLLATLSGHTDWVNSAVFSPNDKKIVTASQDNTAKIWNVVSGDLLANLDGHSSAVYSALFSHDGKRIVTASNDETAKIWGADMGTLITTLKGHTRKVRFVNFSPDGKKIATSSFDSTAKIWDAETGSVLINLKGHTSCVNSAVFSFDSKFVATTSWDETARIWDAATGRLFTTLSGHIDNFNSAVFSPDKTRIVTASNDETAKIWDVATGQLLATLKGHTDWVNSAVFSPDKTRIVTASNDETAKIWDVAAGQLLATLKGHTDWVNSAVFSPDKTRIVTASDDNTAKIWDAVTGQSLATLSGHTDWVNSAVFSPDNTRIVTASNDETAKIWDVATGQLLATLKGHTDRINSAVFSSDGKKIITFSDDSTFKIWDTKTGKLDKTIANGTEVFFDEIENIVFDLIDYLNDKKLDANGNETKVYKFSTGELQYSFAAIDSTDYIIQLPGGYYKSTQNATKHLHYVTKDLKVISFEQLDVKYNRPDKVLEAIGNTDTALIKSYRKAWEKRIKKLGIDTTQFRDGYSVPEADIVNRDSIDYEQKAGTLRLHIKGIDSTYKLDRFNVWVNESPLYGQRGIRIRKKNSNTLDTTITIVLSQGENRIETSITNVNGTESYRMPLYVNYTPAVKQKEMTRFIGIGIDQFKDSQHNLQYSSKDIRDLSIKLKEKYKDGIIIDTLFNENVTAEKVKALKEKLQQTTVNDKVIISYSGHGLLSKDYDYYLSTYAVNFSQPEENGLPYDELESLLDSIPARKKLLLIDACHSGEVDKEEGIAMNKTADSLGLSKGIIIDQPQQQQHVGLKNSFELMQSLFVNVGKSTGATIISAAAGNQFALERGDLKNGVFTYSLLEAMNKYPTIKISELKKIVGERVEQLTNGMQKPTSRNEVIAADWSIW
jgi:WD40 repeat protein